MSNRSQWLSEHNSRMRRVMNTQKFYFSHPCYVDGVKSYTLGMCFFFFFFFFLSLKIFIQVHIDDQPGCTRKANKYVWVIPGHAERWPFFRAVAIRVVWYWKIHCKTSHSVWSRFWKNTQRSLFDAPFHFYGRSSNVLNLLKPIRSSACTV